MPEATAARLEQSDLPDLQRARRLWGQGRWDEAEAAFLRIAEAHPNNVHALVDAARVLGDRMQIRRAQELLERLEVLAGKRSDLLLLVGQTMRMCHREEEALTHFRRYASGPGRKDLVGHLERAVLCERHRLLDEADAAATAALRTAPDCMEALIIRARVRHQQGRTGEAEVALKRVTSFPRTHLSTRAQAWAMLADMADRAGDTATAMELLERAKELLRPAAGDLLRTAQVVLGAWDRVCRALAPDTVCQWIAAGGTPAFARPAAHLLSFPRSGTTLLENVLDAHGSIVSSEEFQVLGRDLLNILWREPGDFSPPSVEAFDAIRPEKLDVLRRQYRERMEEGLGEAVGDRVHIDKNPTHTLFIPGIVRLLPDSRFLVALRDPRDVVVSCYFQYLPANPNSAAFLRWEDAIRRYLLDMGAWLHLRTILPADRWLEVRYEDLLADLPGQARRAVSFLGLPWEDGVLDYRQRVAQKVVHTPSYLSVKEPLYTRAVGRWQHYAKWMEPHLGLLRPMVEAFGYEW
jgi:tetratricopeptide (TPR) repeat protein